MSKEQLLKLLKLASQDTDEECRRAFIKVYDYFDALSSDDVYELIEEATKIKKIMSYATGYLGKKKL